MSAFLEEYGKIIVVIIVVAALIGLAILFKSNGTKNATNSFGAFMGTADKSVKEAQDLADKTAKEDITVTPPTT